MKKVYILAILVGLLFLIYPTLEDHYTEYQQEKLLTAWTESLQNMDTPDSEAPAESTVSLRNAKSSAVEKSPVLTADNKADSEPENLKWNDTMDGILTIDKINLRLPILKGATTSNMKLSVASIDGTGKIGQPGNYCIAGHRSYAYGKNFNRLDELMPGDIIKITAADHQYQYAVTEKLYVKPTDVWALSGNGADKKISLITCDPMINPTQRLVIRAKLINFSTANDHIERTASLRVK